ncbi:sugar transferase [Halobium salinum]|uniref:Sugar transferase n=1 Tax=Halobium salinum TaxID=1364940 RepID=A0ABD5P9X4_9EURY|nr:sugar transferase [Halobium salinum]
MSPRQRHRLLAILGTVGLTDLALLAANHTGVQRVVTTLVPVVGQFPAESLSGTALDIALMTTLPVVMLALAPLYKPNSRRILETVGLTVQRVFVASAVLAAVGYYDYTYRLPRITLALLTTVLLVVLPAWFVVIRRRPVRSGDRAIIVGDDPTEIDRVLEATEQDVVGYVVPPVTAYVNGDRQYLAATDGGDRRPNVSLPDGGRLSQVAAADAEALECLGDVTQLESLLVEHDVDTALFAFAEPDREAFFGALATCEANGVRTKIHRRNAESVLVADAAAGEEVVDVDLEPWDAQDRLLKRLFDVAFAGVGLAVLSPVIVLTALAVKLDSEGPVFYQQRRTSEFGETFTVAKFRSMVTDAESDSGAVISAEDEGDVDPRVTRVGRFIRKTHLDEIPQLWSILVGDMSVVGPRPERPELDGEIGETVETWQRRWFVKPGLTGLAQVNGVTGHDPAAKLEHDILYVRQQSFTYDVKLVVRQLWKVGEDVVETVRSGR